MFIVQATVNITYHGCKLERFRCFAKKEKLMKWKVREMKSWQNVKLMKCKVDEMESWWNGKLMKWKVYLRQVGKIASWQKWQVDIRASWQNGKLTKWWSTEY